MLVAGANTLSVMARPRAGLSKAEVRARLGVAWRQVVERAMPNAAAVTRRLPGREVGRRARRHGVERLASAVRGAAARADGPGRLRAADRVRERRHPPAGADNGAAARNRHASRSRREPPPRDAAAPDRKRPVVPGRRGARSGAGVVRQPQPPRPSLQRARRAAWGQAPDQARHDRHRARHCARCHRSHVHDGPRDRDGRAVRHRACARRHQTPAGHRPRCRHERDAAWTGGSDSRDRAARAHAAPAHLLGTLRADPSKPPRLRSRFQSGGRRARRRGRARLGLQRSRRSRRCTETCTS